MIIVVAHLDRKTLGQKMYSEASEAAKAAAKAAEDAEAAAQSVEHTLMKVLLTFCREDWMERCLYPEK